MEFNSTPSTTEFSHLPSQNGSLQNMPTFPQKMNKEFLFIHLLIIHIVYFLRSLISSDSVESAKILTFVDPTASLNAASTPVPVAV